MKARTTILTLLLCLVAGAMCFASDVNMGTWKLNESKSKMGHGMGKNTTVVYEAAGDQVKVTVDGTDSKGDSRAQRVDWQVRRKRLSRHRRSGFRRAIL